MPPPGPLVRKVTIRLDSQGKILVDGQAVELDQWKNLLVKAREDGTICLEVVVEVDRQCLFEHVARRAGSVQGGWGRKRAGPGVGDIAGLMFHQIHTAGRGIVWSGALEVAELKRDQIRSAGPDFYAMKKVDLPLNVTIEPLSG